MTQLDDRIVELERENAELRDQLDAGAVELRDTQERFGLISQAVAEGVYDWNIAQNRLWVSPRLIELFGWEAGGSGSGGGRPSQDWNARVHPEDFQRYRAALRGVLKRETPRLYCQYRIRLSSGEYRWVEDHAVPVVGEDGRATRLAGAVSDITERKKADHALHELNRLKDESLTDLNAVIDTVDYGVVFMGPDLRARIINRAFREMWGVPDAFIATRPTMADLINYNRHRGLYDVPEAEFDAFVALRVDAIRAGDIAPIEMRRADGKVLRYAGVVLPDGGRLLTYLDITDAKRREAALTKALDQQTATAEVLAVINTSPGDLAPVFDAMLERAIRLCNASFGVLLTYDGNRFDLAALHNVPAPYAAFMRNDPPQPGPDTAMGRILRGERVVRVDDAANSEAYRLGDPRRRAFVDLGGAHSYVCVGLFKDDLLLGTLGAYREEVRPFSEAEIALLENFGAQAVIAMENARLITETREALEQQTATAEVLGVINSSPGDLMPVFEAILGKSHALCGAERGTLFLYDGTKMKAAVAHGYPADVVEHLRAGVEVPPHHAPLLSGNHVHIPDLTKDNNTTGRVVSGRGGVRTNLLVPLFRNGALLGMISCNRTEVRPFSDKEIALIENFAQQAVIAIENARLITETREALDQQTATAEVLQVINSSPGDLAPVFDAMLEKATSLCEAAYGVLWTYDGQRMNPSAVHGEPEIADALRALGPMFPAPGSLGDRLLRGERVVHILDAEDERSYRAGSPSRRVLVEIGKARTLLGVALRKDDRVVGLFSIYRREMRPFTDKQIALLQNFAAQAVIAMENARLITETREALDQQTATAEVLGVINSSPGDLTPVFAAMVDKARRLCNADSGHLALPVGDDFRTAVVSAMSPEMEAVIRAVSYAPGRGTAVGRALMERRAIQIGDIAADPEHAARHAGNMGLIRTILGVPLLREGEAIGAFGLSRARVEPFTERQVALVENFAAQAVIAIENARLITETRRRTEDLQQALEYQTATSDVLRIIASSPDNLEPIFAAMLDNATRLCGVEAGNLYLYGDGVLTPVAARHPNPQIVAEILGNPLRPGPATASARVVASKAPVHIPDAADDELYRAGDPFRVRMVERTGVRGLLGVPLLRGDEVVGTMMIYRPVPGPFTERQIELVRTFADQAVIAIENARLITETREALEQQTATAEVLGVINSSPGDLAPVFDTMVERAAQLCEADEAAVRTFDGELLHLAATYGADPAALAQLRALGPSRGTGLYEPLARGERVTHYIDARETEGFRTSPIGRQRIEARGIRTWLAVALQKDGALLGVLNVHRRTVRPFTDKQIALLENFAAQAVIAMENARLMTETREARDAAESALGDLKAAQGRLIQAEKMASLGQLTAGIAHEIKNPLNFVNNFASLSNELLSELKEIAAPALETLDDDKREEADETMAMLSGNLDKIAEHGRRADNIVKSMLEHSRGVSGERREVDLNALLEESLNLAYHGARAQDQSFNITLERDFDAALRPIELVPQDMTRVFLNLFGNGFYAANKRARAENGSGFRPVLQVATREAGDAVEVRVRDNGTGIPSDIRDKLFQPFFTTKPTGEGTGLGLSISYDIVTQQHGGTIAVASEEGMFTEFIIRLPRAGHAQAQVPEERASR